MVPRLDWIVGLGNPGSAYDHTRHSLGFMVIDELAKRWKVRLWSKYGTRALCGTRRTTGVMLAKPQTFMNNSGESVRKMMHWCKRSVSGLLVLVDDLALPLGTLRLRARGGDGGHNGLVSVIEAVGTKEFARLRMGIGSPPEGMDTAEFVLSSFAEEERAQVRKMILRAADAVEIACRNGCEKTMNKIN